MRKTKIFVGTSHPELGALVTGRLGVEAGEVKLSQFKNKETSVEIGKHLSLCPFCVLASLMFVSCEGHTWI